MEGQSKSLLLVLEECRPTLKRFLHQRLGCDEAAEDVLQALSERLLGRASAERVDNPQAYVFRAAAHAAHSHARGADRRAHYESTANALEEQADWRDPEREALAEEALASVQEALGELPLLTQRVFIAFRVNGEAQRAIAQRYGVSLSTVEKHLAKASIHCRRRLKERGLTGDAGRVRRGGERKGRKGSRP
ncbi:MAG: sigma-70 family RNA polymerase sigma factor [Pseudomonadota bacterium]